LRILDEMRKTFAKLKKEAQGSKKKLLVNPQAEHYTSAMSACFHAGRIHEARDIFEEFLETEKSLNHAIGAVGLQIYGKLGEIETVLDLKDLLLESKIEPTIVFYNALIEASLTQNDFERALSYKQEMIRNRIKPNQLTYMLLVHAIGKDDWQSALEMLDEMENYSVPPSQETLLQIIDLLAENNETNLMDSVFTRHRMSGMIDEYWVQDRELRFSSQWSPAIVECAMNHFLTSTLDRFFMGLTHGGDFIVRCKHRAQIDAVAKILHSLDPPVRVGKKRRDPNKVVIDGQRLRQWCKAQSKIVNSHQSIQPMDS